MGIAERTADVLAQAWPRYATEPPAPGSSPGLAALWANSAPWPQDPPRSIAGTLGPFLYGGAPPVLWASDEPLATVWNPQTSPAQVQPALAGVRLLAERPATARRPSIVLPDPMTRPTAELATYHAVVAALTCADVAERLHDSRKSRNEATSYRNYADNLNELLAQYTDSDWFRAAAQPLPVPMQPATDRRPIAGYRQTPVSIT